MSALLLLVALGALVVRVLMATERARAVEHVTFEPLGWRVVRGGVRVQTRNRGDVAGYRVFGGEVLRARCWDRSWDRCEADWFRARQVERRQAEWRLH